VHWLYFSKNPGVPSVWWRRRRLVSCLLNRGSQSSAEWVLCKMILPTCLSVSVAWREAMGSVYLYDWAVDYGKAMLDTRFFHGTCNLTITRYCFFLEGWFLAPSTVTVKPRNHSIAHVYAHLNLKLAHFAISGFDSTKNMNVLSCC